MFFEPKYHNQSTLEESSTHNCESASPTFSAWVIRKKYVEFVRHTNPCVHNSKGYMFLELSPFSCHPTLVYQLMVRNSSAFVLSMLIILVVRQAILFRND